MTYNLRFSDPTKTDEVIVPDMPPGINSVDTSLSLVGRGYPNYGEKVASNFLHLLENFASPIPPENPIEGQLWYDTSDPDNKILRVMDGTAESTRWPAANGIYQQTTDPKLSTSASLKNGDIWVDTNTNQLKIYASGTWVLVGPVAGTGTTKTGSEPAYIMDTVGTYHYVIKNYVENEVVTVIAKESFVPNTVIEGYPYLRPGVNITNKYDSRFNGTSISSLALKINNVIYSASDFLRKSDQSLSGQVINGKVKFSTPVDQTGAQGRDGIVIDKLDDSYYIQFYKKSNDAVILNTKPGGKIVLKTTPSLGTSLVDTLTVESGAVGINTTTNALSPTLDVYGTARILNTLTVVSTATDALVVSGGISVAKDVSITGSISAGSCQFLGTITVSTPSGNGTTILPDASDVYDLGSVSKPFRNLYVSNILASTGTRIFGTIIGDIFPVGMITAFGGAVAPTGWLLCDGASYSTSTYSSLFTIIQYTYGGSGSSFNVPDMTASTTSTNETTFVNYIIKK